METAQWDCGWVGLIVAWDIIVVKGHGNGCSPGMKVAKWECLDRCLKVAGRLGMFHISQVGKLGKGQNRKPPNFYEPRLVLRKQHPTQLKLLCDMKGSWIGVICLASVVACLFAVHIVCPLSAYNVPG